MGGRTGPKPAPATVALEDQVVAILRDHAPLPLSTQAVAGRARADERATYKRLLVLRREGRVERWRLDGWRCVFWSSTDA